ncbi:FG-GAP-like repeat-containing protein [Vitiosangium sp. GDMCC 1.1324]|uniref:FG-GAP-like repeat-containing protein n=1 Tax=Vitiosangium sp. (strain GDMCC 1.1324) TaxID=2138576 RepID=UPI000D362E95|nr:FG-GAP-like repeat-containing protein [Vitiosangium sp. GDMCC 1.1324]PTL76167.1 hypothetical protein DAT35_51295 [Vitiosangium sp. GDMCC 1.1324]
MNQQLQTFSRGLARVLLLWLGVMVFACRTRDEPGAPREVRVTATDEVITVSWAPPTREGSSPINRYIVTASPGGQAAVTDGSTLAVVRGARHGVAYTFTVRAANEQKEGPESASSAPVSLEEPVPPDVVSLSRQSGERAGCVPIAYSVRQESARRVDVRVEFDADGTGRFQRATQAGSSVHEGVVGVTSSSVPEGQPHVFLWNAARDLPGTLAEVRLRLIASVEGRAGASRTETISLDNRGLDASRCEPDFVAMKNFYGYPLKGVLEDFDGDGKWDVAMVQEFGAVSVARGLGNGDFQLQATLVPGPGYSDIIAGDFNGDGRLDLATSGYFESVPPTYYTEHAMNVMLGKGDGTFEALPSMPLGELTVASMTTGDFNRDGFLDVVTVNKTTRVQSPQVSLFLGKGNGTFQSPVLVFESPVDSSEPVYVERVEAAYLDEDLSLDLVVIDSSDKLRVLPGNGDGTFRSTEIVGHPTSSFVLGDLDADGKVDLVTKHASSPRLFLLRGQGDGTFQEPVELSPTVASPARVDDISDLTNDGKPDLLVTTSSGDLAVLPGNGDGTFQAALTSSHGAWPSSAKGVDVDGDGQKEVVTLDRGSGYGTSGVSVLRGRGNGTFVMPSHMQSGTRPVALAMMDLDGDGLLDVASANESSNNVSVLMGSGTGTFQTLTPVGVGTKPVALVAADVDGDGKQDLVTANEDGKDVSVLLGNKDGTFRGPVSVAVGSGPVSLVAIDLDADGKPELVTANRATNDVRVLPNNGDGTFKAATAFATGTEPMALVAGDVDSDGKVDLVTANHGSRDVSVLLGNGDGTFQAARNHALMGLPNRPQVLVMGDFDRDGKKDLVVGPDFLLLRGNGDGTFVDQAITPSETWLLPSLVAVDVDGDGFLDLVGARGQGIGSGRPRPPQYTALGNNDVAVWLGNGDGSFRPELAYYSGQDPHAVVTGDFDGDGRPDIVAANAASNTLSLLRAR